MRSRIPFHPKIEQRTWRAEVGFDDGSEPWARTIARREFPARAKGLAVAWANRTLAKLHNPPETSLGKPFYHAAVRLGTWYDDSFEDEKYGWVPDEVWEPDVDATGQPLGELVGFLQDDGRITWDDYSATRTPERQRGGGER